MDDEGWQTVQSKSDKKVARGEWANFKPNTTSRKTGRPEAPIKIKLPGTQGFSKAITNPQDRNAEKDAQGTYTVDVFLRKAGKCSAQNPPDILQFSEKSWGAVSAALLEFCLKKLGIVPKSHTVKKEIIAACAHGCTGEDAFVLGQVWGKGEGLHSDFYDMGYVFKDEREDLLAQIKEMTTILLERCDPTPVLPILRNTPNVTFSDPYPGQDYFKLGDEVYKVNHLVKSERPR